HQNLRTAVKLAVLTAEQVDDVRQKVGHGKLVLHDEHFFHHCFSPQLSPKSGINARPIFIVVRRRAALRPQCPPPSPWPAAWPAPRSAASSGRKCSLRCLPVLAPSGSTSSLAPN